MHFTHAVENRLYLPKFYKRLANAALLILLLIIIGFIILPYLSTQNPQIPGQPTPTPGSTPIPSSTNEPTTTATPSSSPSSTSPTPKNHGKSNFRS